MIPLIRLHQGGGGSVTGSGATSKVIGTPVFNAPRFRSVARTMWSIPVATAALGAVAGLPAARLVASHFSVMTKENSQVLVAGPKVVERALKENITKEDFKDKKLSGNIRTNDGGVSIFGAGGAVLYLNDSDDNPDYQLQNIGGAFAIKDSTNNAERLSITSAGNVGIVTTVPQSKLELDGRFRILDNLSLIHI